MFRPTNSGEGNLKIAAELERKLGTKFEILLRQTATKKLIENFNRLQKIQVLQT